MAHKPRVPKGPQNTPQDATDTEKAQKLLSQREAAVEEARKTAATPRGENSVKKLRKAQVQSGKPRGSKKREEKRPARNFSGNTVALLMVLFLAAVVLAPSLRLMFNQQAELNEAQAELRAEQQREDELMRELQRWDDDAYVQQQARERFNMVMPGERKYLVVGDEEFDTPQHTPANEQEAIDASTEPTWADDFWGSFVQASQK